MNTDVLKKCPLFKGVPEYSIQPIMGCLRAHERYYGKNEYIYPVSYTHLSSPYEFTPSLLNVAKISFPVPVLWS